MIDRLYDHGTKLAALTAEMQNLREDVQRLEVKQDQLLSSVMELRDVVQPARRQMITLGGGSGAAASLIVALLKQIFHPTP